MAAIFGDGEHERGESVSRTESSGGPGLDWLRSPCPRGTCRLGQWTSSRRSVSVADVTLDPNQPHDSLVKWLLGTPAKAAAVLQTVLPPDICAAIEWGTLETDDRELLANSDRSTHTDLLFRAQARVEGQSHEVKVLVVIDHQSTDDWTMPARMLETKTGIWRRWLRKHKKARSMPLIVPVLISHTPGGWKTSRSLDDMLSVSPSAVGIARYHPGFELLLVDLGAAKHERLVAWAQAVAARGAVAQGTMLLFLVAMTSKGSPAERVERALRDAAPWLESLVESDPAGCEVLLVYLSVTSKLTSTVIAAILYNIGATKAASKMSTLREMWEQQQREHLRVETLAETLRKQIKAKFGPPTEEYARRIEEADEETLERYIEQFATADTIAAVFAPE